MYKQKAKMKQNKILKGSRGITLIALVITIIVLLILAAVSIVTLTGENGILTKAQTSKERTEEEQLKEMVRTDILGYQAKNTSGEVTPKQLRDVLDKYFKDVPEKAEDLQKNLKDPEYKLKAKDEYGKDIELKASNLYNGKLTDDSAVPTVKIGEETVKLTKEELEKNPKKYLGKVVKNFKEDYKGQEETISLKDKNYTVSKTYRLYYIDFDDSKIEGIGKYGNEVGTVFLKADSISSTCSLEYDGTPEENEKMKIKQLNPGLYTDEYEPPSNSQDNILTVKWLLNENNWLDLKKGVNPKIIEKNQLNYIVGAPSLELMMDSYNTYYELNDNELQNSGTREKLFWNYENNYGGYKVKSGTNSEFSGETAIGSVQKDDEIGSMYYPVGQQSWLASPSSGKDSICTILGYKGEDRISWTRKYMGCNLTPLVSLKPTVELELED